jgi:hypothetical protein
MFPHHSAFAKSRSIAVSFLSGLKQCRLLINGAADYSDEIMTEFLKLFILPLRELAFILTK